MANPNPEVHPDVAHKYAAVVATGRSDFPNQINNVLAFPGIFAGALQVRASRITEGMKIAAAEALAASSATTSPPTTSSRRRSTSGSPRPSRPRSPRRLGPRVWRGAEADLTLA